MKIRYTLKLLVRYPSKFIRWLISGRFHPVSILVIIFTLFYFFKLINSGSKTFSVVFLSIGLGIILWQLIGDSKRFSGFNPNTFTDWLKKIPKFKGKDVVINYDTSLLVIKGHKPHIRIDIPETSSIEEKIKFLLKREKEMDTAIYSLETKFDDKIIETGNKVKRIEDKVEETKRILTSVISDVSIGNYDLRVLSIVLMICGTFLQLLI